MYDYRQGNSKRRQCLLFIGSFPGSGIYFIYLLIIYSLSNIYLLSGQRTSGNSAYKERSEGAVLQVVTMLHQ